MSDDSVRAALRSNAQLVVVEAPAGCGKTFQGAAYARELVDARTIGRPLVLTHTHAACSVFSAGTQGAGRSLEIRTIDSLIGSIACAYHQGIGLPADVAAWIRAQEEGHSKVAARVATFLRRHPMIARALARRHPIVVCDEHQDSSADQHAIVMALLDQGARVRIFADPMQKIFRDKTEESASPACNWEALKQVAHEFEELDYPHRWGMGCSALGKWTLAARATLKAGGRIDLRKPTPPGVQVIYAENVAQGMFDYRLSNKVRRGIDAFKAAENSLLILSHYTRTTRALRSFFYRGVPLWEGHTRNALEELVKAIAATNGSAERVAGAVTVFLNGVGKGLTPSGFGDRLKQEAREGCAKPCKKRPATIQALARLLVAEPNHRGVAKMLRKLWELKDSDPAFGDIAIDCHKEYWEAIRLGEFEAVEAGLAEITHRRTYSHPKPPARAISTIHKAKGLECDAVMVMPCDGKTFPDTQAARCLLYVSMSRAMKRLLLVVSKEDPSPLFHIPDDPVPS